MAAAVVAALLPAGAAAQTGGGSSSWSYPVQGYSGALAVDVVDCDGAEPVVWSGACGLTVRVRGEAKVSDPAGSPDVRVRYRNKMNTRSFGFDTGALNRAGVGTAVTEFGSSSPSDSYVVDSYEVDGDVHRFAVTVTMLARQCQTVEHTFWSGTTVLYTPVAPNESQCLSGASGYNVVDAGALNGDVLPFDGRAVGMSSSDAALRPACAHGWWDGSSAGWSANRCPEVLKTAKVVAGVNVQPASPTGFVTASHAVVSGQSVPLKVASYSSSGGMPPWPSLYPQVYAPFGPPVYDCARHALEPAGGGRWFVDVEAVGPRNPLPAGVGTDFGQHWVPSWYAPGEVVAGQVGRVLTPPVEQMPPGGWYVLFKARRTLNAEYDGQVVYGPELRQGFDFDVPDDLPEPVRTISAFWAEAAEEIGDLGVQFSDAVGDALEYVIPGVDFFDAEDAYGGDPMRFTGGGDFSVEREPSEFEVSCGVYVNPDRPEINPSTSTGGNGIAAPPASQDGGGEDLGDGTCDAGFLGSVPVVGGLFDATARMVCGVASAIGRGFELLLDGLRRLLVPTSLPWGAIQADFEGRFPFTLLGELLGIAGALDAAFDAGMGGDACGFSLDVGSKLALLPVLDADDVDGWVMRPPTPTSSGCGAMFGAGPRSELDGLVGDVAGRRDLVWAIQAVLLAMGVLYRVRAAFGPGETGLEQ